MPDDSALRPVLQKLLLVMLGMFTDVAQYLLLQTLILLLAKHLVY